MSNEAKGGEAEDGCTAHYTVSIRNYITGR